MREMQETHEKRVSNLIKETPQKIEDNNTFKNRLTQLEKEAQKVNEKSALKSRVSQMEKEVQKLTEENSSFF